MYLGFMSFGGGEIFLVFLAVLVLFGADKIPELARMFGKGMNEFRKATDDIKKEFKEGTDDFVNDLRDSQKELENHVSDIKQSVEDDYDPYEGLEADGYERDTEVDEVKEKQGGKKDDDKEEKTEKN